MSGRRTLQAVLLLAVVGTLGVALWPHSESSAPSTTEAAVINETPENAPPKLVAYYFHGEQRCDTCRAIESVSASILREDFATQIDTGLLSFASVNTDEPENQHFREEFGLTHSTLVLVEMHGNDVIRYQALDEVWQLVHEDDAMRPYIERSVRPWLEQLRPS